MALTLDQINKGIRSLKEAGHDEAEINPRDDYHEQLRTSAEAFCKKHSIEIIPPPTISIEELTELAINKTKPFDDHTSGFKDTLIYLSMIEDAKKGGGDNYILCTNNSTQFDQDVVADFKKQTGKNLVILPDILSVQQKLDELVPIGLHLEARNRKVKNLVSGNTGELMLIANKNLNGPASPLWNFSSDIVTPLTFKTPYRSHMLTSIDQLSDSSSSKAVGCNLIDLDFLTIEELADGKIRVLARLNLEIKYEDDHEKDDPFSDLRGGFVLDRHLYRNNKPRSKSMEFTIDCDLEKNTINIRAWD